MTAEMQNSPGSKPSGALGSHSRVGGPTAITNVNVVTMEDRKVLMGQTVVIDGDAIARIAPGNQLDVSGMLLVDGSNQYLMPGLSDMHTHLTDVGVGRLYLANGVTRIRNMDGRPWHLALSSQVASGQLPGPGIVSVSPLIDGLGDDGFTARRNSHVLTDPGQAEQLVEHLVARGYREIKAYQWLELAVLRALGAAAARAGVRMAGHCPDGVTFEEAIDAGMSCFEHLTNIGNGHLRGGRALPVQRSVSFRLNAFESIKTLARHLDLDAIRRLAHTMAMEDIWNCPTLVVWQKQFQSRQQALSDPSLQYEHPAVLEGLERMITTKLSSLPCAEADWLAVGRERDETLAKVVAILHEEGAPLLLGTDAPNPFVFHGFSIHDELANLVRAGLSPYEALRCGTVEAARFLDDSSQSGTVAVGKKADLILLREDPLADIGAVRGGLEAVFTNGFYLSRTDLNDMLRAHAAELSAPPPLTLPVVRNDTGNSVSRHGWFTEKSGSVVVGCASYSHAETPDGGWQVAEHSVRSGPRGPQHCTGRFRLGPDLTVQYADIQAESPVGTEYSKITWTNGEYEVCVRQPDGHTCKSTVESNPLLPSGRLGFSILPVWASSQSLPAHALSLSIEHELAQIAAISADSVTVADCTGLQASIHYPGEVMTHTYTQSDNGALAKIEDLLFGAPRELVAEPGKSYQEPQR